MNIAAVKLWGTRIGAIQWDPERMLGAFEYDPQFLGSGIQTSPLQMPLGSQIYRFPELAKSSFVGLPGMLADSLPDRFGSALIDAWLVSRQRKPADFNPVERLCYLGTRGMGALEFEPALMDVRPDRAPLQVEALRKLAQEALLDRQSFATSLAETPPGSGKTDAKTSGAADILRVGTSAGGARAKAVIAWNAETGEVRSGQLPRDPGFRDWILKFDGVRGNKDRELADPEGYGQVEFAYHRMALAAGITMTECRLLEESGRKHFMTLRFDRDSQGRKLHMQSLAALGHLDFELAGAHSYEQAFHMQRELGLSMHDTEEQFRRMAFNVLARNQDDHVKNIAYLMNRDGAWSLSPAFDLTFAFNPDGAWTAQHQMSLLGKRDNFDAADFTAMENGTGMARGRGLEILEQVQTAIGNWPEFANEAGLTEERGHSIGILHRQLIA